MKKIILILLFSILYFNSSGQCDPPLVVFNSNINFYNANVNWNFQANIYKYRIRYRIVGDSVWSYKNNIDSLAISKNLNNLTPMSSYHWQIRTYCDTGNTIYSPWSIADTFYTSTLNCPIISGQFTNNISSNNATSNWTININADRYKIRYKILGTTSWSFSGPIYHPTNNEVIPGLIPNTIYQWEVMAFYDSTTLHASLWSISDTFTTSPFIASVFNPLITNSIYNTNCNSPTDLTLYISQSENEPDIETSTITSDGGFFDIQSFQMGDSVGYAIMSLTTQTISSTLRLGPIAGQNYAQINSFDNAGNLIGLFFIENVSGGIKISSTSPNDGNNYTSGFTSEIRLTNIFVNPNISGPLNFYTYIKSELNDQFNDTTTVIINCVSGISETNTERNLNFEIYNLLGRKTKFKENTVLIYKYSNGKIRKIINLNKW